MKIDEPKYFHACIVNIVRVLFICLWYVFCSHVLRKLNYFGAFGTYIVEGVSFRIVLLLFF